MLISTVNFNRPETLVALFSYVFEATEIPSKATIPRRNFVGYQNVLIRVT